MACREKGKAWGLGDWNGGRARLRQTIVAQQHCIRIGLTTEQLAERDRIVFEAVKKARVPVAWNLAGGYQTPLRKVLDIHDNTLRACWRVYQSETKQGG